MFKKLKYSKWIILLAEFVFRYTPEGSQARWIQNRSGVQFEFWQALLMRCAPTSVPLSIQQY